MKYAMKLLSILIISLLFFFSAAPAMDQESAQKRIQALSAEITRHDYLYYVLGKPEISDQEYDQLFDELVRLEKEFPDLALPDSPTKRVGSELDNTFLQVPHAVPMLSLEKCYSLEELVAWTERTEEKAGEKLSFVAEEKIDGAAIELTYHKGMLVRASTRGNGQKGYDITDNARTVRTIPLKLKQPVSVTVRGEVFVRKSDFAKLTNKKGLNYDSPRNLAAGALRRKHSSEAAEIPLDIFVFEAVSGDMDDLANHADALAWLNKLGFKTNPNNRTFRNIHKLKAYIEEIGSRTEVLDYEIDGTVVKVNQRNIRKILGHTERFPKWAIAYKFRSPENETVVQNIDVQIGRHGRVTPVAKLHPVRIGSASIARATLHNQDYINMLELAIGDTVKVSRRGKVIPAVEHVLEKNMAGNETWQMPIHCPACKTPLQREGKHHFCPNFDCPDQIRGRLIYFSKKMGIKYLGPKTIEMLISQKRIQHPEDIYTLTNEEMNRLRGFGEKKINAFMTSLEQSKTKPLQEVLAALGIRELGPRAIENLTEAGFDSVDKLLGADISTLTQVKGIGEITAQNILDGLNPQMRKTIKALRKSGLSFQTEPPAVLPGDTQKHD